MLRVDDPCATGEGGAHARAGPVTISLADLDLRHHEVLRGLGEVAWVDVLGGWVVTTRELCIAVMRDA
jgi:hypothetical protein